jgi:ribose 1,5-bisphosphokinase PhnN
MNPTLTALDDGPRSVRVGPHEFKIGPLRVRHLAVLKRHLSARGRDPLERLLRRLGRFDEWQQEVAGYADV